MLTTFGKPRYRQLSFPVSELLNNVTEIHEPPLAGARTCARQTRVQNHRGPSAASSAIDSMSPGYPNIPSVTSAATASAVAVQHARGCEVPSRVNYVMCAAASTAPGFTARCPRGVELWNGEYGGTNSEMQMREARKAMHVTFDHTVV